MQREVMWAPWDGPGLEHLRLTVGRDAVVADGLVVGLDDGRAFRVRYTVRCDAAWRVRELRVTAMDGERPFIHLLADGQGRWTTGAGGPAPLLDGCLDVDLSATPFTNTLPIRRLGLRPGESVELAMVYVDVPALRLESARQRYTCLGLGSDGGRYRYESVPDGFTAELSVDGDGLVLDYPGLFRRVWSA